MVDRTKQRAGQRVSVAYPIDEIANAVVLIGYPHHKVHDGDMFQVSYYDNAVADDANVTFLVRVGAKPAHMTFAGSVGGDAEALMYENPAISNIGTSLAEWCMNRVANKIPETTVFHTPTATNDGAEMHASFVPGGAHPTQAPGGSARAGTEWILAPDTDYLIRIINRAGSEQEISLVVQWYED